MKFEDLAATIRDALSARQVYGEPVERDGVVVVPAAVVFGGGGGGNGELDNRAQEGGGFGLLGRPTGAFVIENGRTRWVPAFDVNRLVMVVGVVLVAHLLRQRKRS